MKSFDAIMIPPGLRTPNVCSANDLMKPFPFSKRANEIICSNSFPLIL